MRITFAYNQRREEGEEQAELLTQENVESLLELLRTLPYEITPVEVSGPTDKMVADLLASRPDLIFNVAEGTQGVTREALYPAVYRHLGLPFTGGGPALLLVDLDKRLANKILSVQGIKVPQGTLLTPRNPELPEDFRYPLMIKPNYEGSGRGIHQDSVVESPKKARELIDSLLEEFPEGLSAEEFIPGRELTVPMLESFPGHLLEIVEHTFSGKSKHKIFDYEHKTRGEDEGTVQVVCPPELSSQERHDVLALADQVFQTMPCPDLGRVDIRLREDGTPYFIEINPLPRLLADGSMIIAAKAKGIAHADVFDMVIRSAARRYGIPLVKQVQFPSVPGESRASARELGLTVGRMPPGPWNAITDVGEVHVGHFTDIEDDVPLPGQEGEKTRVRTGITAVVPRAGDLFNNHLAAGGFVLNGIGEMSGLTQAMEWGWLETPILLTNTMSVGQVHTGIIRHMVSAHPELGNQVAVTIPLVGETDDSFLNDVRVFRNTPEQAILAIRGAKSGPVPQGSIGGGTGMVSFDFSGGIGTSSRVLPRNFKSYTVGVLVQANFGKMRNLTVDGAVVGRELDPLYPYAERRGKTYGSVVVVVATDAPLLPAQLNRLSKRAALGLGRVGSFAATTSGEIVFAFSTGNRVPRIAKEQSPTLNLTFVNDEHMNLLYEAVIEATEEAVLNAMFCSGGMTGHHNRFAPPLPAEMVQEFLINRQASAKGIRGESEH